MFHSLVTLEKTFLTVATLTCHSRKNTGDTNNINNGSVLSPVSEPAGTAGSCSIKVISFISQDLQVFALWGNMQDKGQKLVWAGTLAS